MESETNRVFLVSFIDAIHTSDLLVRFHIDGMAKAYIVTLTECQREFRSSTDCADYTDQRSLRRLCVSLRCVLCSKRLTRPDAENAERRRDRRELLRY